MNKDFVQHRQTLIQNNIQEYFLFKKWLKSISNNNKVEENEKNEKILEMKALMQICVDNIKKYKREIYINKMYDRLPSLSQAEQNDFWNDNYGQNFKEQNNDDEFLHNMLFIHRGQNNFDEKKIHPLQPI